ncbi:MAG: hypothetical protein ACM3PF_11015 [Bacteroidota bacterium]|jgi:hypothetical protein
MADDVRVTCKSVGSGAALGPLWFFGWLFTIGFLKLTFWKGVLALIVWPYYLGVFFRK